MSIQALTNLITVYRPTISSIISPQQVQHRFQNGKVGEAILVDGLVYNYLSFIYQGAAKTRTGDNLVSSLIMSVNPISMGHATEAVTNRWNVQVDTCVVNPSTYDITRTLTTEFWVAASMGYDTTTVEVELSSSLDAVGLILPAKVLSQDLVGHLPTTSNIFAR